jgi:undecaprenyl-diphosphatase
VNDYLLSLILGVVEGLTEFLPVSSTAHLRVTEALLSKPLLGLTAEQMLHDPFWKMYSIVIQLGAVLCLPIYFRRRIVALLRTFPRGERGDRTAANHPVTLTMLAFVVTAVPAFLLSKVIGKNLESLYVMGAALLVGGVVMWVIDAIFGTAESGQTRMSAPPKTLRMDDMTLPQAVWVGACQILSAVFPGTSRSMSTIAGGQVAGMSRPAALEFSFFLSLPTMAAATLYDFYKTVIRHKGEGGTALAPVTMNSHRWVVLGIGFVVSFIVAIAVVHWFMGWVRRRGFAPFAVWRIVAGAGVLWMARGGVLG